MKKKFLAAIIAVLLLCLPLTACGERYRANPIEGKQDTSYVVLSNGGSAVQYGNYIYYINGYRGYGDEDGSENYWGNVVKGGLYRAELIGEFADADKNKIDYEYFTEWGVPVKGLKTFAAGYEAKYEGLEEGDDDDTYYNFVSKKQDVVTGYKKDSDGNIVYENKKPKEVTEKFGFAATDRVASKTIGTSGYDKGGIFIFDEYVYYATPSNKQNRQGEFETSKTSFYRTKLDGTGTIKLYTSKESTSSSEYAFYNQNGKVYLTVHDGSSIISVKVGAKKVESVTEIATDVTGVLFPTKDIYYDGIDTNSLADFIYYTRNIAEDDEMTLRTGNVTFVMRPDGSELNRIFAEGTTITLHSVKDGYLFYEDERQDGTTAIMYTNLHASLMQSSEGYKAAFEKAKAEATELFGADSPKLAMFAHRSGAALDISNIGDYNTVVCFRPDKKYSPEIYSLLISSSGISVYNGTNTVLIYSGSVSKIYAINGSDVIFGNSSGNYYMTNAYTPAADNTVITLGEGMSSSATFGLDLVGNFVMMFGTVDDYASDYAMFVNLDHIQDGAQFVGEKASEDKYDPSVELNAGSEE